MKYVSKASPATQKIEANLNTLLYKLIVLYDNYLLGSDKDDHPLFKSALRLIDAMINSVLSVLVDVEVDPIADLDFKIQDDLNSIRSFAQKTSELMSIINGCCTDVEDDHGRDSVEYKKTVGATAAAVSDLSAEVEEFYRSKTVTAERMIGELSHLDNVRVLEVA
jgi:hypothetical protein